MSSDNSEDRASLCDFTFADGRRCRMLRHSPESQYCFDHQRKLRHRLETDQVASEICAPIAGEFVPATAVAHSLTRVFRAVAAGRINPKTAAALTRVASMLLKSLPPATKEFEACARFGQARKLIRQHYQTIFEPQPSAPREPHTPDPDPSDHNSHS